MNGESPNTSPSPGGGMRLSSPLFEKGSRCWNGEAVTGVAAPLVIQHQAQAKQRGRDETLQRQHDLMEVAALLRPALLLKNLV